MQELHSDNGFDAPELRAPSTKFEKIFLEYSRERNGKYVGISPGALDKSEKYCLKNGINPVFFIHAVFSYHIGEKVTPFMFNDPKVIGIYDAWAERIPAELVGEPLRSPFSVEIHREVETLVAMIVTKHGRLKYEDRGFKIACADPMLDVTACSRILLSEADNLVLKYYAKDYLDWCKTNYWKSFVLQDFGYNHTQIERDYGIR